MFCVHLYGKWARWGRYYLYYEAQKVYYSKKHPNFFLIFAENVRLLFLNIIKLIPLGASTSKYKSPLSPCDNRTVKWQHENENK